jgi:tRNA A37 threonylcarbamoyladenosine modification protein TsaB
MASVAIIGSDGRVLFEDQVESRHQTSGSCLAMLRRGLADVQVGLEEIAFFAADVGPGSFIGTRVGIVLAKTLAYAGGVQCLEMDSFDLISLDTTVVFPSKKGEFFVRRVGQSAMRTSELPTDSFVGYGLGTGVPERFPSAAGFAFLCGMLVPIEPQRLNAIPLIEPSISVPKVPYRS